MTKKEQLKAAFKVLLKDMLDKIVPTNRLFTGEINDRLNECTNLLLEEVTIRMRI